MCWKCRVHFNFEKEIWKDDVKTAQFIDEKENPIIIRLYIYRSTFSLSIRQIKLYSVVVPDLFNILPVTQNTQNDKCSNKTTAVKHTSHYWRDSFTPKAIRIMNSGCVAWCIVLLYCYLFLGFLLLSFNVFSFIHCRCIAPSTIFFTCICNIGNLGKSCLSWLYLWNYILSPWIYCFNASWY